MTCAQFTERLDAWAAGTLTETQALELEQHAAECEACGLKLDAISHVGTLPRELPPPAGLRVTTLRAVRQRRTSTRWRRWGASAAAIAAVALLAIALQPQRKSASDFPGAGRVLLAMDRAKPEFAQLDAAERDLDAAIVAAPADAELAAARERVRRQRASLQETLSQVSK